MTIFNDVIRISTTFTAGVQVIQSPFVPLLVSTHAIGSTRQLALAGSTMREDLVAAGFATSSEAYKMLDATLRVDTPPQRVIIGKREAGDADSTATYTAIAAEGLNFYYIVDELRADAAAAAQALINTFCSTRRLLYLLHSTDPDIFANTTPNIFDTLNSAAAKRTAGWAHRPTTWDYADCVIAGMLGGSDLDSGRLVYPDFKLGPGVIAPTISQPEVNNITGKNGNYWAPRAVGSSMNGGAQTFAGVSIMYPVVSDWIAYRLEQDLFNFLAAQTLFVPFLNAGIEAICGVIYTAMQRAENFGWIRNIRWISKPTEADFTAGEVAAGVLKKIRIGATVITPISQVEVTIEFV